MSWSVALPILIAAGLVAGGEAVSGSAPQASEPVALQVGQSRSFEPLAAETVSSGDRGRQILIDVAAWREDPRAPLALEVYRGDAPIPSELLSRFTGFGLDPQHPITFSLPVSERDLPATSETPPKITLKLSQVREGSAGSDAAGTVVIEDVRIEPLGP